MTDDRTEQTENSQIEDSQMEDSREEVHLLARLVMYGDPAEIKRWASGEEDYVARLGLTAADVPELLNTVKLWAVYMGLPDDDYDDCDDEDGEEDNEDYEDYNDFDDEGEDGDEVEGDYDDDEDDDDYDDEDDDDDYEEGEKAPVNFFDAAIHAWRCLAQLRAPEAVPVLLGMIDTLAKADDDWFLDEFPFVFGWIGLPALPLLRDFLAAPGHEEYARACVAESLSNIAKNHAEAREEMVAVLVEMLSRFDKTDKMVNGHLVAALLDLKAVEAAEVIERAHAADCVDLMTCGNWNMVREELGVEGLGLVPPDLADRDPMAELHEAMAREQAMEQAIHAWETQDQEARELAAQKNNLRMSGLDDTTIAHLMSADTADNTDTADKLIFTPNRTDAKAGRNDPCPCGSGRKYKKCCAE